MTRSIFSHAGAFGPMMQDIVEIEAPRATHTERMAIRCCVFDGGMDDGLADDSSVGCRQVVEIVFPGDSWRYISRMQPGDKIHSGGKVYAAVKTNFANGFCHLRCREIGE